MLVLYFKNDKASLDRSKAQIVNISALRCTLFSETKNLSLNDETETERISMMRLGKNTNHQYLGLEAKNEKNKGALFSGTLKV